MAFCLSEAIPRGPPCLAGNLCLSFSWWGEWRIGPSHPRLGPLGSGHPEKQPHRKGEGPTSQPPARLTGAQLAPGSYWEILGCPWGLGSVLAGAQLHGGGAQRHAKPACRPRAAVTRPCPGSHPGPSPLSTPGSGRWMGCHACPFCLMAQRLQQAWGPSGKRPQPPW